MPSSEGRTAASQASKGPSRTDFDCLAGSGEACALARSIDWAKTPIGPVEGWSQALRSAASLVLHNHSGMLLWWGQEFVQIYNDACRPVLGDKHPCAMGQRFRDCWSEVFHILGPMAERPFRGGPASTSDDIAVPIRRKVHREEAHFRLAYSPVPDETVQPTGIGGVLATLTEITEQAYAERQLKTLRELGARSAAQGMTAEQACAVAAATLEENAWDVPFALFYLLDERGGRARLVASARVDEHALNRVAALEVDLSAVADPGTWPIRRVTQERQIEVVASLSAPAEALPVSPWSGRPSSAIVLPLASPEQAHVYGVLICGVSPHRVLDAGYRTFFELAASQIVTAIRNARALEEERKRAESLAEIDRAKKAFFSSVSHDFRTSLTHMPGPVEEGKAIEQALREQEEQLRLATEAAEIGLWDVDLIGDTLFWPPRMKAMFGISPDVPVSMADFYSGLHPADRDRTTAAFAAALDPTRRALYDVEYRTVGKEDGLTRWVAARGRGIFDDTGSCVRVIGAAIDITARKIVEQSVLGQRRILEMVATGAPLSTTLDELMRFLEAQEPGTRCGLLALSQDGRHLRRGGGPNLPERYHRALDGLPISSPYLGACGDSVARCEAVIVPDVQADTRYSAEWRDLILGCGFRAVRSNPVRSADGRVLASLAMYYDHPRDPTPAQPQLIDVGTHLAGIALERQQAETALRMSREQLQSIVNDSPIGVFLVDSDFRICEVNPIALPVFGNISELIGRDLDEVMHVLWPKDCADEVVKLFRHTLDTGEPYHAPELISERLDRGVTECYEWQIHRIPLPTGRYGVVCYFRDVSAQVLARRALEIADRQKDEFLAMLAHELRNPLAPIRNASEVLARMFKEDARAQSAIGMIKRQAVHLTRLVDDLLDVSRVTQGRIQLHRRPLDLASVITHAVETVEPDLREKRHKLSVTTSTSHEPLYVSGDYSRLVQCVVNLLTNAAKYTDPGGEIRVRTRAEGSEVIIEIADTGAGISSELLPRVFELFVQSERTLDRAQGGLGIGLAIVKRLVRMHGGEITARSAGEGYGATFEIRLPRIAQPQHASGDVPPLKTPPRQVLVIDDNRDAANSLTLLLSLHGHEAEAAYSAMEALDCIESFRPDVALLDLGLPDMNGYQLAERLRGLPDFNGMRLIAVTGYGQSEDRQRTRAAGFHDHLVKPVDLSALERALAGFSAEGEIGSSRSDDDPRMR